MVCWPSSDDLYTLACHIRLWCHLLLFLFGAHTRTIFLLYWCCIDATFYRCSSVGMWWPCCVWVYFREHIFWSRTNNCIVFDSANTTRVTKSAWASKVPTIMLANVMSLAPKMDEVSEFIFCHNINLVFITGIWLKDSVSDGIVQIPGFAVVRKDRQIIDHGGMCAYIQEENCKYKQPKDLNCCEDHESLRVYLRPNHLLHGFSCIIAGVIYHPPKGWWFVNSWSFISLPRLNRSMLS